MSKYIVETREYYATWNQYEVEADSKEEAINKVKDGEGEFVDSDESDIDDDITRMIIPSRVYICNEKGEYEAI